MFAGIDYDTFGIHIVLLREDQPPRYWTRWLEGDTPFDRARDVRVKMPSRSAWEEWGIAGVGLEEQNSNNPTIRVSVQKLKVIQGAILACLPSYLLVAPLNANVWRSTVGLPGNASKAAVAEWVLEDSLGASADWPQDACDAYCLARTVEALTETVAA